MTQAFPFLHRQSQALFEALVNFVYPPHCALCRCALEAAAKLLCADCWHQLTPLDGQRCRRCGCPHSGALEASQVPSATATPFGSCGNCRTWDPALERVLVMKAFGGVVKEAIHAVKFGRQQQLARELGRRFGGSSQFRKALASIDILVPVPLHPARQRERGYNQAECIAAGLAAAIDKPVRPDLLARPRATRQQARLDAAERAENLENAFELIREPPAGTRIGLVDDVVTTGATLSACARALNESSVRSVWALALASPYPEDATSKAQPP